MSGPAVEPVVGRRQDLLSKVSRRVTPWFRTKTVRARAPRPMISFTFDDIPQSAFRMGAAALEQRGARGTFFVAGGLCGRRHGNGAFASRGDIGTLSAGGHEIGCHTFSHPDMQGLGTTAVMRELDANANFLAGLPDVALRNFAYPYGSVAIPQKRIVQRRFRSARSTTEGINHGRIDLGQLLAVRLYDHLRDAVAVDRLIRETVAADGWLIFYTHDVADRPSEHGCTPGFLAMAVEAALRHACPVLTVDAALDQLLA